MNDLSLCFKSIIGISFITVIVDMILIDGNFKKYVKSIMGIIMTIIIIGSFVKIKDTDFNVMLPENEENQVVKSLNVDLNYEVTKNVEKNIKESLLAKNIVVKDVKVEFLDDYIIKKVFVILTNNSKNEQTVIDILVNDLEIEKERIKITYDKN